jgi:hypothetical protein
VTGKPAKIVPPLRGAHPRDIYIPDLHLDTVEVKRRDFR